MLAGSAQAQLTDRNTQFHALHTQAHLCAWPRLALVL